MRQTRVINHEVIKNRRSKSPIDLQKLSCFAAIAWVGSWDLAPRVYQSRF